MFKPIDHKWTEPTFKPADLWRDETPSITASDVLKRWAEYELNLEVLVQKRNDCVREIQEQFFGAIEAKLQELVGSGISVSQIGLQHHISDPRKTVITVTDIPVAEFFIDHSVKD